MECDVECFAAKVDAMRRLMELGMGTGLLGLCCGFLIVGLTQCSPADTGPKVCKFDNDCRGENERCVYSDPTCGARVGECEGICKAPEVPEKVCACQQDEDCNYPFEGCTGCKCYKRNVLPCKTDADCGRGRLCVGDPGKRVCEVRTACTQDTDCIDGYVCRDQSCCNVASGRCPGQCKTGSPCQDDVDCLVCDLSCKDGACTPAGPSCSGVKCETDAQCTECGGKCEAGYCRINSTPTCAGRSCASDADCLSCGGSCQSGLCQSGSGPSCGTSTCINAQDCQASGFTSCVGGCCQ